MAGVVGLGGLDPWRRPKPKKAALGPVKGFPKGPRPNKFKPPTGGKTKPVAPIVKPPVKPVVKPPAPPKPDFNAWYKSDPRYLNQNPQFQAARSQTYAQYGWFPVLDAAGKPVLNAQGQPTYRQATAQEAPGSITNQFAQALAGQSQNIQDSANSRGLLFSGAQVQGQQNAIAQNDTRLSEAQLAFQRALSATNTDEASLVNSLYGDYLATAPPATPATAAAAKPALTPAQKAAAEADRKARIKKAQDHLRQDKINAAKKKKPAKKTTTGKKATIGSSAGSVRGIG